MSLIGSLAAKLAAKLDDRAPVFYAADVILFALHESVWHVLLIERRWAPHKGKRAFPGGHVDDETSEQAARREAAEETGLDLSGVVLDRIGVYDAPGRDARGRYVSVAYGAVLSTMPAPVAGDDAASAAWMPLRTAARVARRGGFAFDHADMLTDAARLYGIGPDSPGVGQLWS
ncbi:NUDIX hydrolase [Amycolatopsis sp. NPDC051045]|uniref:NUDIX hydrolase n=1 Tax=Amycolatopsis sp. NPDC051045 TaxID=3156922 RepID=UPI0034327626